MLYIAAFMLTNFRVRRPGHELLGPHVLDRDVGEGGVHALHGSLADRRGRLHHDR